MNDDDNLYFSFDDEQGEDEPAAEESQNRSFLIGALVLAAVFVLGICAVLIYLFVLQPQQAAETNDIALTNAYNMTMAAATQTALAGAGIPTQEPVETTPAPGGETGGEEQPGDATATSTPEVGLTVEVEEGTGIPSPDVGVPEGTEEGAEGTAEATTEGTVEATEEATGEPETGGTAIAEVTQGPASPTPLRPAVSPTAVSTSGIIEVTPLGGPTPTQMAGAQQTPGTGGGQATQSAGGPIQPTAVGTLPTTGSTSTFGLFGAGLLAVALAAVVMIVRYMRLK